MDPQLSLCPWCSPGLRMPSWPTPPTARHRLPPIALPRAIWSPPHMPPTPRRQHQILARHADLSPGTSAPASSLPATPSLPCLSRDPRLLSTVVLAYTCSSLNTRMVSPPESPPRARGGVCVLLRDCPLSLDCEPAV